MLRHYDKIGLLKPVSILENGYRAYASAQIETVSSIRLYQCCGFTLSEIVNLLDADEAAVQQAARAKLTELDQMDKTRQSARGRLLTLSKAPPMSYTNRYDVSYIQQSELPLLCCTVPVTEAKIETEIERLYYTLSIQKESPDGFCLLLSDLGTSDTYRVAVPVKETLAFDGYESVILEAGWYLSTMHHGDYFSIGMAYDRLICCAEEKGHLLKPPFLERYLLDAENTVSPAQYLTQIFVRLTP